MVCTPHQVIKCGEMVNHFRIRVSRLVLFPSTLELARASASKYNKQDFSVCASVYKFLADYVHRVVVTAEILLYSNWSLFNGCRPACHFSSFMRRN
jgi:hypothetical protein